MNNLIEVNNLSVSYYTYAGEVKAVRNVSFSIPKGHTVALVGESGCGKTVTSKSLMGLVHKPGRLSQETSILFDGREISHLSEKEWNSFRGKECAMIFQDALTALNPTMKIGRQVIENLENHYKNLSEAEKKEKATAVLQMTELPDAAGILEKYPHELSGGQRQRVMIAMALITEPKLLIADEPTTSLDVTIQAQILELMKRLQKKLDMTILLITHDMGIVADVADEIMVMYAGKIVEQGTSEEIFFHSEHPYTRALLGSVPRIDGKGRRKLATIEGSIPDMTNLNEGCAFCPRCQFAMKVCADYEPAFGKITAENVGICREADRALSGSCTGLPENDSFPHKSACWLSDPRAKKRVGAVPQNARKERTEVPVQDGSLPAEESEAFVSRGEILFEVSNLEKYYPVGSKYKLKAVDDVSFAIREGETLGIVGESGCGKTTCGKTAIGMLDKTKGQVLYRGMDVHSMSKAERFGFTREVQMIFQDPYASLDSHQKVYDIVAEGIRIHKLAFCKEEERRMVGELLSMVGLSAEHANRHVHEFSGGQRQRIGIARALSVNPKFLLCDEPVSALDVSLQAQIVNLLMDLQRKKGLTMLFIAHDLSLVRHISDRVIVMYLGRIMESGPSDNLYENPLHPYTKALLSAVPIADPKASQNRKRVLLQGDVPSPINPPAGCRFCGRCEKAMEKCRTQAPLMKEVEAGHFVACHLYDQVP